MFDNPFDFSIPGPAGGDFGPTPLPPVQPPNIPPVFNTAPFAMQPQPMSGGDLPGALATHLASQGVTPSQFLKNPAAAPPPPAPTPSLGESLAGPTPTPTPTPAPQAPTTTSMSAAAQPRGLRNNNPLNIEDGPFAKSMPGYVGGDGRFAKFETADHGTAAAGKLLDTYSSKYGLNTVNGVIGRWAPSSDGNDVKAYASYVAGKLGIDPDAPIPPEKRQQLVQAMSEYENGTGSGGGSTDMSAKTGTPAGQTSFGQALAKTLAGVKAPPAPTPQKVSSPTVPHSSGSVKGGELLQLLQSLIPQQQTTKPLYLSSALGR